MRHRIWIQHPGHHELHDIPEVFLVRRDEHYVCPDCSITASVLSTEFVHNSRCRAALKSYDASLRAADRRRLIRGRSKR